MSSPAMRRYLDHPATSWPKPDCVVAAVTAAIRDVGAAAGRGTHAAALQADAIRRRAREAAARIVGVPPERVALPAGATLALNMAIHGVVERGWHVIATAADHNATLRPLHRLARAGVIDLDVVSCDASGRVDPDEVARAWRPATRLLVFSHASNVTGALQDAPALLALARRRGAISILDAAQTAGVVPLAEVARDADVVVAPGHKWLQGPEGIAVLAVREGLEPRTILEGGTGSGSDTVEMPECFAERMEAGTPNLAALAGLEAAAGWLEAHGTERVATHGRALASACRAGLRSLERVRLLGDDAADAPPIVAFTVEGYDPAEVAVLLEQLSGVQARAGFHCAALVHRLLGTAAGGTVRVGFGPFNTADDVRAVLAAVAAISGASPATAPDPAPFDFPQEPPWQA